MKSDPTPAFSGPEEDSPSPPVLADEVPTARSKRAMAVALVGVLLLAAGLRLYALGDVPAGLFCDEASIGYNAYCILKTGSDEHGAFMPLYFEAFGEYKNPVYIYTAVASIGLLGLNDFALRLTSAVYGILTVLFTFLLARELFNSKVGLLAAGLLSISPWHIHFSRISFELISLPCFFVAGLWLFLRGLRVGRKRDFCVSGIAMGIALYTYAVAKLFVPLFGVGLFLLFAGDIRRRRLGVLLGLLVFLLAGTPLAVYTWKKPDDAMARWHAISIVKPGLPWQETGRTFWKKYQSHLSGEFLFRSGDPLKRHGVRGFGQLYKSYAPLVYLSLALICLERKRAGLLLVWWLVLFPVGASLTTQTPTAARTIVGIPVFELIVAHGLFSGMRLLSFIRPRRLGYAMAAAAPAVFLCGLVPEFTRYLHAYFVDYPIYSARGLDGFEHGYRDAIRYMEANRSRYDLLVMTATNALQPRIFTLYYGRRDPRAYQHENGFGYMVSGPEECGRYSLKNKILFALRPGDLKYFIDYEVKETVVAPDGAPSFLVAEVYRRRPMITDWWALGLLPNNGADNADGVDPRAADLTAEVRGVAGPVRWQRYAAKSASTDLNRFFSPQAAGEQGKPESACAYLLTDLVARDAERVVLEASGSDHRASFWLDGVSLGLDLPMERARMRELAADLHPGRNRLAVKSCQATGDWNLQVAIRRAPGREDDGVRIEAPAHASTAHEEIRNVAGAGGSPCGDSGANVAWSPLKASRPHGPRGQGDHRRR